MCRGNTVMITVLAATTVFHTRRRCSQDDSAGRSSTMSASWNTAEGAMPAVAGYMGVSRPPTAEVRARPRPG